MLLSSAELRPPRPANGTQSNRSLATSCISERLTHDELAGGEIDRRIMELIYQNFMVIDLDRDWLNMFKNRTDRGEIQNVYYGIGKVLDAGSLFAQYTGDPKRCCSHAVHHGSAACLA